MLSNAWFREHDNFYDDQSVDVGPIFTETQDRSGWCKIVKSKTHT